LPFLFSFFFSKAFVASSFKPRNLEFNLIIFKMFWSALARF
jgi:hypothetical protein